MWSQNKTQLMLFLSLSLAGRTLAAIVVEILTVQCGGDIGMTVVAHRCASKHQKFFFPPPVRFSSPLVFFFFKKMLVSTLAICQSLSWNVTWISSGLPLTPANHPSQPSSRWAEESLPGHWDLRQTSCWQTGCFFFLLKALPLTNRSSRTAVICDGGGGPTGVPVVVGVEVGRGRVSSSFRGNPSQKRSELFC